MAGRSLYAQGIGGIISYPENGTDAVATFTGTDPEGQTIYWSLGTAAAVTASDDIADNDIANAGEFSISSDGVLTFKRPPNYKYRSR